MSNKSRGADFECDFAERLSGYGFWVHRLQDNRNGQPFDVIAARDGITYVFDCKDCSQERFPFSRIEENQKTAMRLWWECGNTEPMFAIQFPLRGVRVVSFSVLEEMTGKGCAALAGEDIDRNTLPLERWVAEI